MKASIDINANGVKVVGENKTGSDFTFDLAFGLAGGEGTGIVVDGMRSAFHADLRQMGKLNNMKPIQIAEFKKSVNLTSDPKFEIAAGYPMGAMGGAASTASKDAYNKEMEETANATNSNAMQAGNVEAIPKQRIKVFLMGGGMVAKAGEAVRDKSYVAPKVIPQIIK